MSYSSQARTTARIVAFCVACTVLQLAEAQGNDDAKVYSQACGSQSDPVSVLLPFEMQASFFHSMPIAGLLLTPDAVAERVALNPRVRATTGRPISGKKSLSHAIDPWSVVDTRADRTP